MTLLLKDPDAVVDYSVDWGADYLSAGELLANSEWSVVPDEAGGIAIVGSDFDATMSWAKTGGGVAGRVYSLCNRITTGLGRIDDRSIVIRVEKR